MLSQEVQRQLDAQRNALQNVEVSVKALLVASQRDLTAQLEPLQQASVHLALAKAVCALYKSYLRLHGADVKGSPFAKDVERLDLYCKKVQKAESEKWLKEHKPSLTVDVAAANRFISTAIPDLTPAQRKALRKASSKEKLESNSAAAVSKEAAASRMDARQEAAAFLESMEADAQDAAGSVDTGKRKSASTSGLLERTGKKRKMRRKALQMEAMLQQEAAGS